MSKLYLFIYNDECGSRDEIKSTFSSMSTLKYWRYDMPYVFYIVSEHTSQELYDEFIKKINKGRFMFIESTPNAQGVMLVETWEFINKKSPPKKNTAT